MVHRRSNPILTGRTRKNRALDFRGEKKWEGQSYQVRLVGALPLQLQRYPQDAVPRLAHSRLILERIVARRDR